MAPNNAYQAYNNSKIMTASPAELTLMLYEGAIKFCNIAIMGVEEKNVEKAHTNIMKVERSIEEFQATLDHKYAIAEDFDKKAICRKIPSSALTPCSEREQAGPFALVIVKLRAGIIPRKRRKLRLALQRHGDAPPSSDA